MITAVILDVLILSILLIFVFQGWRKGALRSLGGILAVIFGIFASTALANSLSFGVSQKFVLPAVQKAVVAVLGDSALSGVTDNLSSVAGSTAESITLVLDQMGLNALSMTNFPKQVETSVMQTGTDILESISNNIAWIVVFSVSFFAIQILAFLLLRLLNQILKLPLLGMPNKLFGAAFGAAKGSVFIVIALWVLICFTPSLFLANNPLSADTLQNTFLARRLLFWLQSVMPF